MHGHCPMALHVGLAPPMSLSNQLAHARARAFYAQSKRDLPPQHTRDTGCRKACCCCRALLD